PRRPARRCRSRGCQPRAGDLAPAAPAPGGLHFPYGRLILHPRVVPILQSPMRLALALLAVLAFAVPAARAAAPIAETFSIEDARGTVTIRGTGIVIGRLERGEIQIVVRGEGFSISARGQGSAVLDGSPDVNGSTGTFAVGDVEPAPVPTGSE